MNKASMYISTIIFIGLLAGAQVWLSHLRLETARQTHIIQQETAKLQEKMQALGLEYASLVRPERLRQLAHRELGMQAPRPMQILQP